MLQFADKLELVACRLKFTGSFIKVLIQFAYVEFCEGGRFLLELPCWAAVSSSRNPSQMTEHCGPTSNISPGCWVCFISITLTLSSVSISIRHTCHLWFQSMSHFTRMVDLLPSYPYSPLDLETYLASFKVKNAVLTCALHIRTDRSTSLHPKVFSNPLSLFAYLYQ